MNFLGLGQGADLEIQLELTENQRLQLLKQNSGLPSLSAVSKNQDLSDIKDNSAIQSPPSSDSIVFYDGESVKGKLLLKLKGAKLEHQGIRIELLGRIEFTHDRGSNYDFLTLSQDLARPGILSNSQQSYPFEFTNVSKQYETYLGTNVKLRYFLRATVLRRLQDLSTDLDLTVYSLFHSTSQEGQLKMEVGIEDCLHIEFQYNKTRYHLKDVIIGKIYFLLVRVKIQYMELQFIRRESLFSAGSGGSGGSTESETIARYELMDGAPARGECIPIRVFLSSYAAFLTPTMRDVCKKFSVRYCLNLVLVDEEDRRYFKQQEIILYRKSERQRAPIVTKETIEELMRKATMNCVESQPAPIKPKPDVGSKPQFEQMETALPTGDSTSTENRIDGQEQHDDDDDDNLSFQAQQAD